MHIIGLNIQLYSQLMLLKYIIFRLSFVRWKRNLTAVKQDSKELISKLEKFHFIHAKDVI